MQSNTKYVLDTNVFVQAHRKYYAFDIAPSFWDALVNFAKRGEIVSIDKVLDEIKRGEYDDELKRWALNKFYKYFENTQYVNVVDSYKEIINWAQKQQQYTPQAKDDFFKAENADPWVIAFAYAYNLIVVTQEAYNPNTQSKIKIPNVCKEFEIEYINTFELLRRLNFKM